jgi:hypothetical protein
VTTTSALFLTVIAPDPLSGSDQGNGQNRPPRASVQPALTPLNETAAAGFGLSSRWPIQDNCEGGPTGPAKVQDNVAGA